MTETIEKTMEKMSRGCSLCEGRLIDTKKIVTRNNKIYYMNVKQCNECGHSFSNLYEVERLRKEMNPNIIRRIKSLFSNEIETLSFFKGRIL